jgi:hypothetical protein
VENPLKGVANMHVLLSGVRKKTIDAVRAAIHEVHLEVACDYPRRDAPRDEVVQFLSDIEKEMRRFINKRFGELEEKLSAAGKL